MGIQATMTAHKNNNDAVLAGFTSDCHSRHFVGGTSDICRRVRGLSRDNYCAALQISLSRHGRCQSNGRRRGQRAMMQVSLASLARARALARAARVRSHFGSSAAPSLSAQRGACEPAAKDSVKRLTAASPLSLRPYFFHTFCCLLSVPMLHSNTNCKNKIVWRNGKI